MNLGSTSRSILLVALLSFFGGCADARGSVTLTAYGEQFVEEGIPATDDGWAIGFDRFLVRLRRVAVGGTALPVSGPVDLTRPSQGRGHSLGRSFVPEGSYDDVRFTLERLEVEGQATRGNERKTFAWIFDEPILFDTCDAVVRVEQGKTTTLEITLHADHLFFDSLVAEEPALVFQALADADADENGEITEAELAATDIGGYDPGSEGGIDDLWSFLRAQVKQIGHVDGEGHCESRPASP